MIIVAAQTVRTRSSRITSTPSAKETNGRAFDSQSDSRHNWRNTNCERSRTMSNQFGSMRRSKSGVHCGAIAAAEAKQSTAAMAASAPNKLDRVLTRRPSNKSTIGSAINACMLRAQAARAKPAFFRP